MDHANISKKWITLIFLQIGPPYYLYEIYQHNIHTKGTTLILIQY